MADSEFILTNCIITFERGIWLSIEIDVRSDFRTEQALLERNLILDLTFLKLLNQNVKFLRPGEGYRTISFPLILNTECRTI
jgi:hypothetical protein